MHLDLAERLGAKAREPAPGQRLGRYPITVEASGTLDGLHRAIRATEPDGVCTSIGIHAGDATPIPLFSMYITGMTLAVGRVHSRAVLPEVLEMAASGAIALAKVTSKVVRWEDAVDALSDPPHKLLIVRE